ncbi:MAG TPA: cation diffusion facilitator family transporter [Methylovirgula sp.]|nr:cation diffusion facilitator family transporter [Methylovirgula sp.]
MDGAQNVKERAALFSIVASALLTAAKIFAGLLSGSLALLSEAGHNLADTGITIITYFAVRAAGKPADEEHNYGHAKIETLAALIETGFLFALAIAILVEAVRRLAIGQTEINANLLAFGVLIVSIGVDISRSHLLSRVAHETKSDALAADLVHFASDMVGSFVALLGLIAARFGYPQGDALAALTVALVISIAGYKLGRRAVDTLIDAAPKGLAASLRRIAGNVPGVIAIDSLRLRPAGANVFGDLVISVPRTLPQEKVAAITDEVGAAVAAAHPGVALTVATTPVAADNESVLERVLLIAAKRHAPVHHVIVQQVAGRTSLSFDVEVDGRMPLGEAHAIASRLEADARKELGPGIEVETHIEPLEPRELSGRDAPTNVRDAIAAALAESAAGGIVEVHNVRVRETPEGLIVNYHCRADPRLSVGEVHHAVDELERRMKADFPAILRIVGHAEPLR